MSLQALEQHISRRIKVFADDLLALVQQSVRDSAASELAAQVLRSTPARSVARKPRPTVTKASRRSEKASKRSDKELGKLVRAVRSKIKRKPGLRMEQLAAALDIPSRELQLPIKKLLAELVESGDLRIVNP